MGRAASDGTIRESASETLRPESWTAALGRVSGRGDSVQTRLLLGVGWSGQGGVAQHRGAVRAGGSAPGTRPGASSREPTLTSCEPSS